MWTVERITDYCKEISESMGDTFDCPVAINGRFTRTLGRVKYQKIRGHYQILVLEIAKSLLATCDDESIKQVIMHEWAHYYLIKTTDEDHGHDAAFKRICHKIGCTNDGCETEVNRIASTEKMWKYEVTCDYCNEAVAHYAKRTFALENIDLYLCPKCGKAHTMHVKQNW